MEAPTPPPPPLFIYANVEAMQNAEGVFVANLLCYSSAEETRFMCWTAIPARVGCSGGSTGRGSRPGDSGGLS